MKNIDLGVYQSCKQSYKDQEQMLCSRSINSSKPEYFKLSARLKKSASGFTLIEVMVALGIFAAIALMMSDVTTQTNFNLEKLEKRTIATWIAKNHLTKVRLGEYRNTASSAKEKIEFASQQWEISTTLKPFELKAQIPIKPKLMVVEVQVAHADNPEWVFATMTGYMAEHEFR